MHAVNVTLQRALERKQMCLSDCEVVGAVWKPKAVHCASSMIPTPSPTCPLASTTTFVTVG